MKNKTLKTIGLVGLLGLSLVGCKKESFELTNVGYGGNMYNKADGEALCVFYNSGKERIVVINKDKKFDQAEIYKKNGPHIQGNYNVSGYRNFFGGYVATDFKKIE